MTTRKVVHPSIKVALGYDHDEPDAEVMADWKARTTRVCKPCWELKYCPYGPLVEQSPTLPPERTGMIEQIRYFRKCFTDNTVGGVRPMSEDDRTRYSKWVADEQLLRRQALYQISQQRDLPEANKLSSDDEKIAAWLGGPPPPIHIYRAPYELDESKDLDPRDFSEADWNEILEMAEAIKQKYKLVLQIGELDNRSPLEPVRAAWFRKRIDSFDPLNYPEETATEFSEAQCNIFGHICPVFFSAEASTETSAERRRGRYISFTAKMRVVRRDNHTCQHCGKHLKDDEVEFDHIIPVAKGGSSEEHNIRLTCFDCNRDKGDEYVP